eukprot:351342-Chlamydomonas_euryale.AAC.10
MTGFCMVGQHVTRPCDSRAAWSGVCNRSQSRTCTERWSAPAIAHNQSLVRAPEDGRVAVELRDALVGRRGVHVRHTCRELRGHKVWAHTARQHLRRMRTRGVASTAAPHE